MVNYQNGALTCSEAAKVRDQLVNRGDEAARRRGEGVADQLTREDTIRWGFSLGRKQRFEVLSLALGPDEVVAVLQHQQEHRAQPEWSVAALDIDEGGLSFQQHFTNEPLPGGLLIEHDGRVVVVMLNGTVYSYGT